MTTTFMLCVCKDEIDDEQQHMNLYASIIGEGGSGFSLWTCPNCSRMALMPNDAGQATWFNLETV